MWNRLRKIKDDVGWFFLEVMAILSDIIDQAPNHALKFTPKIFFTDNVEIIYGVKLELNKVFSDFQFEEQKIRVSTWHYEDVWLDQSDPRV